MIYQYLTLPLFCCYSYDGVYEDDLPGLIAVKTLFWDKGQPDVEVYIRRQTIEKGWIWLATKAVSYIDQPIPGIILLESEVEDEYVASQINRIIRITAILVQAVEAAKVAELRNAELQRQDISNNRQNMNTEATPDGTEHIPLVAEDAAAYKAMMENAYEITGIQSTMEESLRQIMNAAAEGGLNTNAQVTSKLEQEIMERIGGKKKESFNPFSLLEEARKGVRLDLGMVPLSPSEVQMITLVLTGKVAAEDLVKLVFCALSTGYGIDKMLNLFLTNQFPAEDLVQFVFHALKEEYDIDEVLSEFSDHYAKKGILRTLPSPIPPPIAVLNLSYTYMGNRSVEILSNLIQMKGSVLRTVDISFCGLDEEGCLILAQAFTGRKERGIKPIRGLILSGNHISYTGATELGRALCPDEDGNGLQLLHLGLAMKDAESTAQFLHGLGPKSPIQELSLTSNHIGSEKVSLIADFLKGTGSEIVMPKLDRLDLSNNNLGNEGLAKLAAAISNRNGKKSGNTKTRVVALRLSNNGIGHRGIEMLMNKLHQHNLVSLSLDKNAIGDQGCQLVAASLNSMRSLTRLNLAFNQIGSRGVNSLMKNLLACDSITYVSLSGNIMKISGAVALAFTLAQHPRLEELHVDNCCLSQAAQCHIIAGIISNRLVPMKRMNGFEAGPPMVALGALDISKQSLSNEECFRIRKEKQMKTLVKWMESNRKAKKDQGANGSSGKADSYTHFLSPEFVQGQNDNVRGMPSQNAYLRLLGWLSRIPFDEDELISLRKYFYDFDRGSEDRSSEGYINLKLRGDLLAALESDVADEIRDDVPWLVKYVGSVGIDLDQIMSSMTFSWDYMRGKIFDRPQRVASQQAMPEPDQNDRQMSEDDKSQDEKNHDLREYPSARSSISNMTRSSRRSFPDSDADSSYMSQADGERKRKGTARKARIEHFPQFVHKLEELKATATEMIDEEQDPEQQEVILTQYAEASLTILRQLRYHFMNMFWQQGTVKRKILIIDDSLVTRKLIIRNFEKANFIVDAAENGAEGVELLKQSIYDIAFMDIDMPVMNGFEATKLLRQWEDVNRPGVRQPICALTANYVDNMAFDELVKYKAAGITVMESKPCKIPRLFKVVDDVAPMFDMLTIHNTHSHNTHTEMDGA